MAKIFVSVLFPLLLSAMPFMVLATELGEDPPATSTPPADLPINPNLPIPDAIPVSGPSGQGPAGLVANLYTFSFLIAGFLAFASMVFAGALRIFSPASHHAKSLSKDLFNAAWQGLVLLLLAYLILRTINPDLTNLRLPRLEPYSPPIRGAPPVAASCHDVPLTPVMGDALAFENGATLSFRSNNPEVWENLIYLQEQVNAGLAAALAAPELAGVTVSVSSAYRPLAYQAHFWEIRQWLNQFAANPELAEECPEMHAEIMREQDKHRLGSVVSRPTCTAPHVRGTGVDLSVSVPDAQKRDTYAALDRIFEESRRTPAPDVNLDWQGIPGDENHFNAINPPNPSVVNCQ